MADVLTMEPPVPAAGQVNQEAGTQASRYSRSGDMLKARMPFMVKGAGYVGEGNMPLSDSAVITTKSQQAALELRSETYRGYRNRAEVVKGLNQDFLGQFGYLKAALTMPSIGEQLQQVLGGVQGADLTRSFTAGNLGIGSVKK